MAQSSVNFRINFSGTVDCQSPIAMNNVPISGEGTGQINADGSASADVTQTAVLSTRIHFEGKLGRPTEAPGGTAITRVSGKNSLRLMWNLPNNHQDGGEDEGAWLDHATYPWIGVAQDSQRMSARHVPAGTQARRSVPCGVRGN